MIRLWQENGPNHGFLQRRRTSSGEATIQKAVFHTDASETAKGSDKQKRGRSASRRDGKWKEWKFRGSRWLFKHFRSSCFRLLAVSNQQAWDFRLISRFHTHYNRLLVGTEVCMEAGSHQTGSCWILCPLNPSPPHQVVALCSSGAWSESSDHHVWTFSRPRLLSGTLPCHRLAEAALGGAKRSSCRCLPWAQQTFSRAKHGGSAAAGAESYQPAPLH